MMIYMIYDRVGYERTRKGSTSSKKSDGFYRLVLRWYSIENISDWFLKVSKFERHFSFEMMRVRLISFARNTRDIE